MGNKDSKAKEYFCDNRRFADICNAVLFNGKQVIQPSELRELDSTEVLSVFGIHGKEKMEQKWRDLLKLVMIQMARGICFVIIGLEEQSDIHYAIPVKNMLYDVLNYGKQINEAKKKHLQEKDFSDSGEFLSGFTKEDKLTPVITITLYLGAKKWDAPRKLSEMFHEVPQELQHFLPEYHANVIVPEELRTEELAHFQTEVRELLKFIKASNDKEKMTELIQTDERCQNLDNETVRAINLFTKTDFRINEKAEVTDMCKAWDDMVNESMEKGEGFFAALVQKMIAAGESDKIATVAADSKLRKEYYQKYSIMA